MRRRASYFVFGTYGVLVPAMLETLLRLQQEAHPLADAPTVRMAKLIRFEIEELDRYGKAAMEALANGVDPTERKAFEDWLKLALLSAQGLDGKPPAMFCLLLHVMPSNRFRSTLTG